MSERVVIITITRIEAEYLDDLVGQFADLLATSGAEDSPVADPALGRLVPDAYRDDDDASAQFRTATQAELLGRRASDAARMRLDLARDTAAPGSSDPEPTSVIDIALDDDGARMWLRTLTAIRLVIASRLGIESEDDGDKDDPRFAVYDWLGYRLEGLIRAIEE